MGVHQKVITLVLGAAPMRLSGRWIISTGLNVSQLGALGLGQIVLDAMNMLNARGFPASHGEYRMRPSLPAISATILVLQASVILVYL